MTPRNQPEVRCPNRSTRLPNGPHSLSREAVEGSQRERLFTAVAVVVDRHGSAGLTVQRLIDAAGISRRSFYELFADKEEVVLAAYDAAFARLLSEIERACAGHHDWAGRIRAGIGAALGFAAGEPEAMRLLSVEALGFGPAATQRVLAGGDRVAALLSSGRSQNQRAAGLPPLTERALVAAIWMTIGACLIRGEVERLTELEPELVELTLLPYLGAEATIGQTRAGD